ncbi:MAG: MarR family transcriptional regulator [Actinomycetota bacterium]|nr:MarR family transcriptional regulator [Actinomycetota bacterium]
MSEQLAPADLLTLEDQVCFALSVADRRVVAVYRPLLEPLGLTHPQYLAMVALWQHAPVTLKRLGELLALDSGTLSPLLKRLEGAGLIHRRRDTADERSLVVELTEQGLALRERAASVHQGVVERLGLDRDDFETMRRVLTRIIEAAAPGRPGAQ